MIFNPITSSNIPNFAVPNKARTLNSNSKISQDGAMSGSEFLNELKSNFKEVNIITGKITPDNSQNFAFSGTGLHNIAVSEKYINDMASTPEKRAEFVKKIEDIVSLDNQYKSATEQDGSKLVSHGVIIDSEGGMRGWSHSTQSSEGNSNSSNKLISNSKKSISETMQELREKRKEKAEAKKQLAAKRKAKLEAQQKLEERTKQKQQKTASLVETEQLTKTNKFDVLA